jgi:hypothetical protein
MAQNDISEKPGFLKRIFRFGNTYIDYKMGMIGALVMGFIVFRINYHGTHNLLGSFTASLKQGTYTLFFGGIIMRSSELLSIRIRKKAMALLAAVLIPSIISLTLTFGIHSLKGTPKPIASTIPTAIFVIPSTLVWGIINRKKYDKKNKTPDSPNSV